MNPAGLVDIRDEVRRGISQLWQFSDETGVAAYAVTRLERYPSGVEWCWVACAGRDFMKYARLLNWVMARPQIQEEAVKQIADLLEEKIAPDGLAVVMEADHFCMHWRGTKDDGARMVSSVMRGRFLEDSALRREFLALMASRAR